MSVIAQFIFGQLSTSAHNGPCNEAISSVLADLGQWIRYSANRGIASGGALVGGARWGRVAAIEALLGH